ncbi:MAG: histidine phosphatase family protein [Planctomycetota bacterium]
MPSLTKLPAKDTCLMYLIRHGATRHNQMSPPRLQGSGIDESLSELGQKQADRVAGALAEWPIEEVFCSPMKRAVETAAAIAERHGLDATPVDSLVEVNVGRWEGKSWPEIEADDPDTYRRFRENPIEHGYPGGETIGAVIDRVTPTLAGLMADRLGKQIVVVAHSIVIRTYLGSLMGLPPNKGYEVPAENCAVNLVRWKNGKAKAVTINAVGHLM